MTDGTVDKEKPSLTTHPSVSPFACLCDRPHLQSVPKNVFYIVLALK